MVVVKRESVNSLLRPPFNDSGVSSGPSTYFFFLLPFLLHPFVAALVSTTGPLEKRREDVIILPGVC